MKTYTEILYETIEDDFHTAKPITEGIRIRVAKEYAKQWVEQTAIQMNGQAAFSNEARNTMLSIFKAIDAQ